MKISPATVYNIEGRISQGIVGTPNKKRKLSKRKLVTDPSMKFEIKDTVYKMYEAREHITLHSLRDKLSETGVVNISATSLWRVLLSLGFKYKKEDNRRALCEQPQVAALRTDFLQKFVEAQNHENPRSRVYLDETWVFQKGGLKRCWQDENIRSVKRGKSNEGKRYVILHAGTKDGFIDGAGLIFSSSSKSADYHDNMNKEMFMKWVEEQLIPNLKEPSLIIMDNASYHSAMKNKPPTLSSKKDEMIRWLEENGIRFERKCNKTDLYKLIKDNSNKQNKKYIIDELFEKYGHKVLRTPPYHCQFNAIELAWATCKRYYDNHIGKDGYKKENVLAMWDEALQSVKGNFWNQCVAHTEKLINECWEKEKPIKTRCTVEPIIIHLNESEESDCSFIENDDVLLS